MKSVFKSIDRVLLQEHSVTKWWKSSECKKVMTVLVLWPKLGRFQACSLRVKKCHLHKRYNFKNFLKNWPGFSEEEGSI